MRIDIQTKGFELTDGLRQNVKRRLRFALSWASNDVDRIIVRLSDINGPRGGNDKRCAIQIPIPRMQDVIIEDTRADLYVAINRAVDRAEHTIARKLERRHEHRHQRMVVGEVVTSDDEQYVPEAMEFAMREVDTHEQTKGSEAFV
ncbi:MAG: HPF/RaiA family ribosome-associated protein [Motiliproteus sp.]